MRIVALLALAAFGVVTAALAMRLLALARRTRQLPELTIGLGFLCMGLLGLPLAAIGRIPALVGSGLGEFCFVAGTSVAHFGIGLVFVFTWSVFRRHSRWGTAVLGAFLLGLTAILIGLVIAGTGSNDLAQILPRTRPWALGTVGAVALAFGWTGCESLNYHAMLRRRRRLGLSDPVVTDRFLLWGVSGLAAALMCGSLGGFLAAGVSVLTDTRSTALIAVVGSVASAAFYLSFLPPRWYVRIVRQRAARSG